MTRRDLALVGRSVPSPLRIFFTGVRVAEATAALLEAAREEGRLEAAPATPREGAAT